MSFMPNVGTIVRMWDGRIAIVCGAASSPGDIYQVMFADGHQEEKLVGQLAAMLMEEDVPVPRSMLLLTLLHYLSRHREEPKDPLRVAVRTTQDAGGKNWTEEARTQCRWGVRGTIIAHSDSHGLCYEVVHADQSRAWYAPEELEMSDGRREVVTEDQGAK